MHSTLSRRDVIRAGFAGATAAAIARLPACAFADDAEQKDGTLVPFLDPQPIDPKHPMLKWEDLRDWITPSGQFFNVSHYGTARVSDSGWHLKIEGLIEKPLTLSLDEIRRRPRRDVTATLECSGNGASAGFMGAIGNARWTGTPLIALLQTCGIKPEAIEVAFWGADKGKEKIRDHDYEQNFARALPIAEAKREDVILAYEMNGKPLEPGHGFPLRLIVPGWYGIAWVKWLNRIELRDRRLMNRFMARDYVTIRGERHGEQIEWKESSVGRLNLKSLVGRVTRRGGGTLHVTGAAWGPDAISAVEVKTDDAAWQQARLGQQKRGEHAWVFWSYDWKNAAPGEHTLICRAKGLNGQAQPANDDDAIKLKQTYWEANQQYPRKIRI